LMSHLMRWGTAQRHSSTTDGLQIVAYRDGLGQGPLLISKPPPPKSGGGDRCVGRNFLRGSADLRRFLPTTAKGLVAPSVPQTAECSGRFPMQDGFLRIYLPFCFLQFEKGRQVP